MASIDGTFFEMAYCEMEANNCPCPEDTGVGADLPSSNAVQSALSSELGVDFDCLTDITPNLTLASGWRNLANALGRRLLTQNGFLFDTTGDSQAADYGEDIRAKLNAGFTDEDVGNLEGRIHEQMLQDERVIEADVDVVFTFSTSTMTITIDIETKEGPFTLIMNVSALTVEILDGSGTTVASA
jgi:hypothetical protein